jgi:hypothetical protein
MEFLMSEMNQRPEHTPLDEDGKQMRSANGEGKGIDRAQVMEKECEK